MAGGAVAPRGGSAAAQRIDGNDGDYDGDDNGDARVAAEAVPGGGGGCAQR